jgi:hypothetical protein
MATSFKTTKSLVSFVFLYSPKMVPIVVKGSDTAEMHKKIAVF